MTRSLPIAKLVACLAGMSATGAAYPAEAETSPPADTPVDVQVPSPPPRRRIVAIEWNPLSLIIDEASINVVLVPIDHHALILSPFYVWADTQPVYVFDDQGNATQLPKQKFSGFGGEIGYRYYTGLGGPRGFFAGPSLILAGMTATAQNGQQLGYLDYGFALDIGYEALVADNVALTLGTGIQYSSPDKSIPNQQFPADIYANSRFWPRALASIGWAF